VNPKSYRLFNLTQRSAIVTGSGRGIGRAIARGLAEAGARVMICGRTKETVRDAADELRAKGHEVIDMAFDARNRGEIEKLVNSTVSAFGSLDIMVINHGIALSAKAEDISHRAWDEMLAINLTSAFSCAQIAGRQMIAQAKGGSIVFTGSINSLAIFESLTSYGVAKAGVDQLVRQLAVEWGPHNIRVNCIAPGYSTNYMRGREGAYDSSEDLERISKRTPLGRKGTAEELVGPVVFLASDAASFVTGHVMPIDGGWCLR